MKQQEETMLLRDADVEPTDRVLEDILGKDIYKVYKALIDIITAKYKLLMNGGFTRMVMHGYVRFLIKKDCFLAFYLGKIH